MKVSLNWAQQVSNVNLTEIGKDKLIEKIGAQLGAIEEVVDYSQRYEGILMVKIVDCQQHPNANKLQVCTIDDGGKTTNVTRDANGHITVVCGAPNARAGIMAAWIPPGVTVPSSLGKQPLVIKTLEIRGVTSTGMLASLHELGISDDHSGILEIQDSEIKEGTKAGDSFTDVLGLSDDVIIDIENKMFTHRPDCFGILGVARELAGIQGLGFKSPDWYLQSPDFQQGASESELPLQLKVTGPKAVPRFMAATLKNIEVRPSPLSIQADLSKIGIRPINNIVDLTNYYMYLTAQPLHAYDYDKLKAISGRDVVSLETRMSKKGDKIILLGGKQLELKDESTILITSNDVPVGIGGVMGGADTEVDANTKNIVLECASFDMYTIRRTAMQYGLFTDAVTRFTKGQSTLQNDRVLARLINDIQKIANGSLASEIKDVHGDLPRPQAIKITSDFINSRLGEQLAVEDMAKLLKNVEFDVQVNDGELSVTAPFWRTDIDIPEDVVEEIGRLYGYDHLPLDLPKRSIKPPASNDLLELKNRIRNILSSSGANEVLTYTFVHGNLLDKVGQNPEHAFQLSNALSPDLQYYRLSLLPSLLEKVHQNIKQGYEKFGMFEMNPVHAKEFMDADGLPKEDQRLAFVFTADSKGSQAYSGAPYYQAKEYLTVLLDGLGIADAVFTAATEHEPKATISQAAIAPFEKRRTALIKTASGEFIGELGEFKSAVIKNLKLPKFTAGFELDLEQLAKLKSKQTPYVPLPRFPRVEQDITLKVPSSLSFAELFDFMQQEVKTPSKSAFWFAPLYIYQAKNDEAHKNITLRFTIASYERTLTTAEVNSLLDNLAAAAKTKFGAERI